MTMYDEFYGEGGAGAALPPLYLEKVDVRRERKRFSTICLGLLGFLIFTIIADVLFTWLVAWIDYRLIFDNEYMSWISATAQYLVGFPLCVLIITRIPSDPMEQSNMSLASFLKFFLIAVMALYLGDLLGMMVNDSLAELLGHTPTDIVTDNIDNTSFFYNFVTSVLCAPICEEIVFRKLLVDRTNRLGDQASMLLSGILFGLFHGNFYQFFYAMFVGFVFAYIYLRTAKLRYTIALHMLINFFFGVCTTAFNSLPEIASTIWGIVILIAAAAGFVVFLMNWKRIRILKGWLDLPNGRWGYLVFPTVGFVFLFLGCAAEFVSNIFLV